jgi:ABC-type glycerol-3-phosphate transport system substrate-binding protein
VTLSVWFNFGAQHNPTVDRLQNEFMAQYPHIKIDRTDIGDWDQMRQKTLTAFSAGTGPDVFRIAVFDTAMYAVRNAVIALDELIDAEPTMGSKDVFIPGFLANVMYGGKTWALPWKGSAVAFFWNPRLFGEAGLDPQVPPKTWQEVAEFAKRLTKLEQQQYGMWVLYSESAEGMNFFGPILYSFGADLFDSLDPAAVTKAAFNTDRGVEALQYVLDLIRDKCVNPPGLTIQDAQINERVAMWIEGQWAVGNYRAQKPDFKFETSVLPDSPYCQGTTVTGGDHIAISTVCKHVPEAWTFCAYCNTPEVESWYWPLIGGLPGRKEVAKNEVYATPPYKAFMDQLEKGAKPRPGVPDITEILAKIMVEVQLAEFGKQDAKTALAEAERKVNEVLEKRRQMSK